MIRAAPEISMAVNAVRLQMDWRPLVGLVPADAGTMVERLIAESVLDAAVEAHNADMRRMR